MKKIFVSIALMVSLISVCAVELNSEAINLSVNVQANGDKIKLTKISNSHVKQYATLYVDGNEMYVVTGSGSKGYVEDGSRFGYTYAVELGSGNKREWWGFNL